jgi:hypothetical protein
MAPKTYKSAGIAIKKTFVYQTGSDITTLPETVFEPGTSEEFSPFNTSYFDNFPQSKDLAPPTTEAPLTEKFTAAEIAQLKDSIQEYQGILGGCVANLHKTICDILGDNKYTAISNILNYARENLLHLTLQGSVSDIPDMLLTIFTQLQKLYANALCDKNCTPEQASLYISQLATLHKEMLRGLDQEVGTLMEYVLYDRKGIPLREQLGELAKTNVELAKIFIETHLVKIQKFDRGQEKLKQFLSSQNCKQLFEQAGQTELLELYVHAWNQLKESKPKQNSTDFVGNSECFLSKSGYFKLQDKTVAETADHREDSAVTVKYRTGIENLEAFWG